MDSGEGNIDGESRFRESGFRKERRTKDHIFVLNMLINNRIKEMRGKLYVVFVGFKVAFGTISRRSALSSTLFDMHIDDMAEE